MRRIFSFIFILLSAMLTAQDSIPTFSHDLADGQIMLDLNTATNLNATPITYSPSPIAYTYYDLTHVWSDTYNEADSCQAIVCNDGIFRFSHLPSGFSYGGMSWEGFTLSTVSQDTANVLGCVANGGINGLATPYIIGYYSDWVSGEMGYSSNIIRFDGEYYPEYVYICQNSNTYKAITQGEFNASAFTEQDTLSLIIQALDSTMTPTATTTYYLAVDGTRNEGWVKVPLTSLGKTSCLSFSMTTTDVGRYGANTPMYFALDGLTINSEMPTSLPNTSTHHTSCRKVLHQGRIMILQDGTWYDILGRKH